MTKAIVLFSGGLDSTACLYWSLNKGYSEIILLSFTYGSKEDTTIEKVNRKFADLTGIESKILHLPFLNEFIVKAGSALSIEADSVPEFNKFEDLDDKIRTMKSARNVWVPARNLVFLSIASSLADTTDEAVQIIFGANKEEGTTFPDNTLEFIERFNKSVELGCMNNIKVIAPFVDSNKQEIAKFLVDNDVPYEFSSSCYQLEGWTTDEKPIHCGYCESCLRRKRAFKSLKIEDKTIYQN